ncbi:MAG: ABC transporter ATP-binding protein [Paracoccaceae bacterium]
MSLIKVENLAAGYGLVEVLRNISLEINQGEVVAVLGSNGVGKTTLNNCLSGLIKPNHGKIFFQDEVISNKSPEEIVDMGLIHVPEGRKLFPNLTVKDNLELGSYRRGKSNRSSNLENVLNIFPKLSERISQTAGTLSGGEQQMVAIGRGLMGDPRLLLLDEPSLGLSPLLVEQMFDLIKKISDNGLTVLLVEQNVTQSLSIADRAYVIEEGAIAISGLSKDRLKNAELKRSYLGL